MLNKSALYYKILYIHWFHKQFQILLPSKKRKNFKLNKNLKKNFNFHILNEIFSQRDNQYKNINKKNEQNMKENIVLNLKTRKHEEFLWFFLRFIRKQDIIYCLKSNRMIEIESLSFRTTTSCYFGVDVS